MDRIKKQNAKALVDSEVRSKPNYYSILPATVRYSTNLSWFDKILYSEIAALSNKHGYCYATNEYLADALGISVSSVSRSVSNLNKNAFVYYILERVEEKTYRKIYLHDKAIQEIPLAVLDQDNKNAQPTQKRIGGVRKNAQHNSINSNSINNTIESNTPPQVKPSEVGDNFQLPSWLGKTRHDQLGSLYEYLWKQHLGQKIVLSRKGRNGAILKQLIFSNGLLMASLMMIVHFEWRGLEANDNRILDKLKNSGFPLGWIPANDAVYKTFILDKLRLDTLEKQEAAIMKAIGNKK